MTDSPEYNKAMRRYRVAVRRGNLDEARAWLGLAERHQRIAMRITQDGATMEKRAFFRKAAPHRLESLESRARFGR
jgi:hypothetical protein